eukprot:scaffold11360_cov114-Isochrysis_galbana.AAC.12
MGGRAIGSQQGYATSELSRSRVPGPLCLVSAACCWGGLVQVLLLCACASSRSSAMRLPRRRVAPCPCCANLVLLAS